MKNYITIYTFLSILAVTLFATSVFGQHNQTDFYIPYWEKAYKIEAALTIDQVNSFKEIEETFAQQGHDVRQQQFFWKEERDYLADISSEKLERQLEIISDKQLEIAKDFIARDKKEQPTNTSIVSYEEEEVAVEERAFDLASFDWQAMLQEAELVLNDYYLSERAALRNRLESSLTKSDKELIKELKEKNKVFLNQKLTEFTASKGDIAYYEDGLSYLNRMILENLMTEMSVEDLLHSNADDYYAAKDLAEKYDAQIDEINKEVLLLNYSTYQKFLPIAPTSLEMPSWDFYRVHSASTPEWVEISRNLLFLFWSAEVEDGLQSDRAMHSLTIYPIPAINQQTLQFELKKESSVQIEIIRSDGTVLQEVFFGNLPVGLHQQAVDIQELRQNIFFYRVQSEDGVSLVKSLKVD